MWDKSYYNCKAEKHLKVLKFEGSERYNSISQASHVPSLNKLHEPSIKENHERMENLPPN